MTVADVEFIMFSEKSKGTNAAQTKALSQYQSSFQALYISKVLLSFALPLLLSSLEMWAS